ncbi:hypothetical protein C2E23DRAFT_865989 [Lenzites betulinus]|nr:hypothetical protein C2E23DRAFT_865989 [Lenzites betulinus]
MFKRVAKRIRKKEREEELGLDGELKEILGMNNIDSDDDSSDSDSGGSSDDDRPAKRVSGAQSDDSDEDSDGESDEEEADEDEELDGELDAGEGSEVLGSEAGQSEDEEDEDEDEDEEGEPPMSVSEALQNPLYIVSLEPEIKACVICPGKLIKNPIMGDVHIKSTAHTRRFTRVREAAMAVDADTDIRLLVRAAFAPQEAKKAAESTSKRAQKKRSWMPSKPSARTRRP